MEKNNKLISAKLNANWQKVFDEIREARPDLHNNNEIIKQAVREFWQTVRRDQKAYSSRKSNNADTEI